MPSFILANCLQSIIRKLISSDQTTNIKQCFIGPNIRMINDVIEFVEHNQMSGLLLFLEDETGFDSLEHDYIIKTLKHFNFGDNFIQ